MRHLLDIETLSESDFLALLENGARFIEVMDRELKKVPTLRGKTIINLFLEPSTRTRTSFELAAKRLSADAVNISASGSSVVKGETLLDTALNIQAMAPDVIVLRHKESLSPHFLARHLKNVAVVNAGDGMHEHPTQALLDCLTLKEHFEKREQGLHGLKIAIVGDIRHSRVARSNVWAHKLLGNEVRLVGPPSLLPFEMEGEKCFGPGVVKSTSLEEGLDGVDVVMVLRMQLERQGQFFVPTMQEYSRKFCVSEALLKRVAPDSVVLHPGPMNRGTEISTTVADGPRSLISRQVRHGVAVRMAVLLAVCMGFEKGESYEAAA